jgi:hypothetical protein
MVALPFDALLVNATPDVGRLRGCTDIDFSDRAGAWPPPARSLLHSDFDTPECNYFRFRRLMMG